METMVLEQIYYFVEIVGVIAVIASLVYVGKQLRQNTETIEATSWQAALDEDTNYLVQIINHPEILLSRTKPEQTNEELVQHFASLILYFSNRKNDWAQYQRSVMDEVSWERYKLSLSQVLQWESTRNWWVNYGVVNFDADFVAMVNGIHEKTPVIQGQIQNFIQAVFGSPDEFKSGSV